MILKMTIENVCREKGLDCEVENTDISSARGARVDAVFTSHELADELRESLNCPIYPIKRYMDKEEVGQAIDEFLKNK
jgi:PTS system ascorbate-specific IIB component